ncbi:hypothetical protein [Nocardioides sp. LML1-1-1.1]|uniref:hypothetical protein n=1 Tax=Nocardioides sp. LML1-1-1.1 TaxID=3135248 RepID=UPI00343D9DED
MTMARHVTVHVVVEPIETTGGHWCTRCLLPSGWLSWVTLRCADRMHLQLRAWCDECGARDTVVPNGR